MVVLTGGTTLTNNTWDGTSESLFIEIPSKKAISGAIALEGCVFRRCRFTAIGILVMKEQIELIKQGFILPTSHNEKGQRP